MAPFKCLEVLLARAVLRASAGGALFGFLFAMNLTLISAEEPGTIAPVGPLVRVATFNGSLYRDSAGMLAAELETGNSEQAIGLAKILQTVRPDIVLVNEVDFEADHRAVRAFIERYLAVPQQTKAGKSLASLDYPHFFAGPVNTGVASGLDLSGDGNIGGPNDAWGYGKYEGQYGMVVLSRFPIAKADVRTFQKFLWKDLPDAKKPIVPNSGRPFYPDDIWTALRLSSKSHWDVPVIVHGRTLHILASHPTPPAFDGPEDRNGCRNHDEIRFWTEYVSEDKGSGNDRSWLRDDQGTIGGLVSDASFVVVGDLNADPVDGSGIQQGIADLLSHRRVFDPRPKSEGALEAASRLGKANARQRGDAACDTSQFSPNGVGNLRVDYCLPSSNLAVEGSGVFWPAPGTEGAAMIEVTDHRLVWCDIRLE